ncbi:hypothetical protein Ddye_029611 [Dipteronia dyeriana]|uniref:Uncharacterized protein n=1 Tax=Dipteronia dyeriana TaxID=168575 RepID=A0AAD9TFV1_9ROSI|nr:hypothetical protein Ddye_029611 [Dipteronia dyeriana]
MLASEKSLQMAAKCSGDSDECITRYAQAGSCLESQRYFLSRRTVLEMLRDRGYDVSDSELALSLAEFRSIFGDKPDPERLRFYFPLRSNPTKKMLVMFLGTDQVKTKDIREMCMQIVNRGSLQGLILILQSKVTASVKKEMEKFSFKVEFFQIADLLVNITKHILAPKYEILNAAKKHQILKKYEVEEKQLPWMLETDAIARYYGLEKGQVVKVTYSGGTVDALETYRCIM